MFRGIMYIENLTDENNKLDLEEPLTVQTLNVLQSKEYKGNLILSSNEPLNKRFEYRWRLNSKCRFRFK